MMNLTLATLTLAVLANNPATDPPKIVDQAKLFSDAAVKKAEETIARIQTNHKKSVVIETFAKPPQEKDKEARGENAKARQAFFAKWAQDRAKASKVNGIYVLICKDPAHLRIVVDGQTIKKSFTAKDRDQVSETILAQFKSADFDQGLLLGMEKIEAKFTSTKGAVAGLLAAGATSSSSGTTANDTPSLGDSSSLWNLLIIAGVVLVGFVLMRALFSAMSGGAGGGGFFSSLLGGIFGAAAGMWMYDQFFGNQDSASADAGATGAEDYSSSGGDFGDSFDGGGEF